MYNKLNKEIIYICTSYLALSQYVSLIFKY